MKLYDDVNIKDNLGLNGYVIIKNNKTGEILLEKHNMILAGAKKVLLSKLLFRNNTDNAGYIEIEGNLKEDLKKLINYQITECIFYNNFNNEVTYEESLKTNEELKTINPSNPASSISFQINNGSEISNVKTFPKDLDNDNINDINANSTMILEALEDRSL